MFQLCRPLIIVLFSIFLSSIVQRLPVSKAIEKYRVYMFLKP